MCTVTEAALTAILSVLVHSALYQPLAAAEDKYSRLPNHINGADRMYVHAQTHGNQHRDSDFGLPSRFCAKTSATPGETTFNKKAGNCDTSPELEAISRNDVLTKIRAEPRGAPGAGEGQRCSSPSPSATFVTALYDIGRGNWAIFPRPYSIYLNYFKDVLKLKVNLVVIVEQSDREFVWQQRREANLTNSTHVWTKPFEHLAFHRFLPRVRDVVESEDFRKGNENLRHPEAFSPEYIILMNSKLSILQEVAEVNPFCTSHFVWIDAGYGHGKNVLPPDGATWVPRGLIDVYNKVTIIQLERPILYEHYKKTTLFKLGARPAFIGGFFGGDSAAVNALTALHEEVFESFLDDRLVHEDQMMMLMCYFRKPEYFNPVEGSWYDGYTLFH